MENNEYNYQSTEQNDVPEAPTYTTATKPEPTTKTRTAKKHRLSTAARVCMWIVGSIAGLTIIFTCVLVWISGLQYIGVIGSGTEKTEETVPSGDTYNFFIYDDTITDQLPSVDPDDDSGSSADDFEDYFGGFFGGESGSEDDSSEDDEAAQQQSGTPGLGITIVALELQFAIDDKYTGGLVIDTIEDYSSFVGTEVRVNDMIVAAEGEPTPLPADLKAQFEGKSVGDEITLTIARYTNGVAETFDVTVNLIEMQN